MTSIVMQQRYFDLALKFLLTPAVQIEMKEQSKEKLLISLSSDEESGDLSSSEDSEDLSSSEDSEDEGSPKDATLNENQAQPLPLVPT